MPSVVVGPSGIDMSQLDDTVIDMGAGDQLVLKNLTLATLPQGWLFVV
jgi:hypothetical protein